MLKDGIEIFQGKTNPNLLLIAPHGYPDDDENTGDLVRSVQKILDCTAIINEFYRKPKPLKETPKKVYEKLSLEKRILNLNYKPQAEKLAYYIEQIQQSIKDPNNSRRRPNHDEPRTPKTERHRNRIAQARVGNPWR